jgi:hypothetical protein
MITDGQLLFTALAGQTITTTAVSTNSIDLGPNARDIGILDYPTPLLVVSVLTAFASSTATATLTIQLQAAPNYAGSAGVFQTIAQSPAYTLGQLAAGFRPWKRSLEILSELPFTPVNTTLTTTASSTAATAGSGTGILDGMQITGNANLEPGTTVSTGGGTTSITLSTAALTSGTAVATTFSATPFIPRFLQLNFSVSATMTAGSLFAGIVLDTDKNTLYQPGYSFPAGA